MRRVVITGIGVICASGHNRNESSCSPVPEPGACGIDRITGAENLE